MRECVFDGDVQKHVHSVRTVASQGSTDGDGESEWTVEKLYVGAVDRDYTDVETRLPTEKYLKFNGGS